MLYYVLLYVQYVFIYFYFVCTICLVLDSVNLETSALSPAHSSTQRVTLSAIPIAHFCFYCVDVISGSLMSRREEAEKGLHDSTSPRSGSINLHSAQIKAPSPAQRYQSLRIREYSPDIFLRPLLCLYSIFYAVVSCDLSPAIRTVSSPFELASGSTIITSVREPEPGPGVCGTAMRAFGGSRRWETQPPGEAWASRTASNSYYSRIKDQSLGMVSLHSCICVYKTVFSSRCALCNGY